MSWTWCLIFIRCVWVLSLVLGEGMAGGSERGGSGQGAGKGEGRGWKEEDWADRIQVYAILDEVFLAGEVEETSKQVVLTRLEHLDKLE